MKLDDDLCLCFHVTKRKVLNFIRVEKPQRPVQNSESGGAGTGCGWCPTYLVKLYTEAEQPAAAPIPLPTSQDYYAMRQAYIGSGGGTPPNANAEPPAQ
jgi:bacterioferritin-associated ferredoxin